MDILANIVRGSIQRFNLVVGGTFFANANNMGFYDELVSKLQVTYIPGGNIQNALRITSLVFEYGRKK